MPLAPSPLPSHIYKILPHHSVDPRYAFPIPIPASHEFFVSDLDAKDGFMHFSTPAQLEGTLSRFFSAVPAVTLLKCNLARLSGWKVVKWEQAGSGGVFPHLYATLEGENVESFKELVLADGESWATVLQRAQDERWLHLHERRDGLGVLAYAVLGLPTAGTTPLVLVHGLTSVGLVDWLPLAHEFAKTRQVMIFDNRNMGHSVPNSSARDAFTMLDLSNDVVELVQAQGWEEIDLLGFSMGGSIALQTLINPSLPFRINHAVLCSTAANARKDEADGSTASLTANKDAPLEDQIATILPFIHGDFDPTFVANVKNAELLRRRTLEYLTTNRPEVTINQQLRAATSFDVRAQLGTIPTSVAVLVTHGTADSTVLYENHEPIVAGIKHAQLLSFKGIGHSWYDYYTPTFWSDLICGFLDGKVVKPPPRTLEADL
ncbi:hypothetical protein RQP46_009017 [Phenoliferia psychrophenolica]